MNKFQESKKLEANYKLQFIWQDLEPRESLSKTQCPSSCLSESSLHDKLGSMTGHLEPNIKMFLWFCAFIVTKLIDFFDLV